MIKTTEAFDYEDPSITSHQLTFTIDVSDGTSNSVNVAVTVPVGDLNDNDPTCSPATYFATIAENTATGMEGNILNKNLCLRY